jgi:5-methylthioadenosine/S-adenosylhomocysteine deaminase
MATRIGAQAMHIGDITGSLVPGKRADLIVVDTDPLHNSPRFERDPNGAYAQIVYAAKSTDVCDVMVNGQWLMRDKQLLTLNESELLTQAAEYARKIDAFLTAREQSVLSKLIALGGSSEEESYEVQVKVKLQDPAAVKSALQSPAIEVLYQRHYRQYDIYFSFDDPSQGRLRYREDDFIDAKGKVTNVRTRLTLIGENREGGFDQDVLLSRSRYLAPATQTLRFYREYFKPVEEKVVEKDRLRWKVKYQGEEFYINLDTVERPDMGHFLEIKSRTWSRKDAQQKAKLSVELLTLLGVTEGEHITSDYVALV